MEDATRIDFGTPGTIWLAPNGDIYTYERAATSRSTISHGDGTQEEGRIFYTYYFKHLRHDSRKVTGTGVFRLPAGCAKVWEPTT